MMGFGGVGYGGAWLWMLAGVLFVVGIVLLLVRAIGTAAGRPDEDDAIAVLRARFARGEIRRKRRVTSDPLRVLHGGPP